MIFLAFQSINVGALIPKPLDVIEFLSSINYNARFKELDFFSLQFVNVGVWILSTLLLCWRFLSLNCNVRFKELLSNLQMLVFSSLQTLWCCWVFFYVIGCKIVLRSFFLSFQFLSVRFKVHPLTYLVM